MFKLYIMRLIFLFIFLLGCINSNAQLQSISGKVIEQDTKEPILFGTVAIYKNGVLIKGTDTDFDGNYFLTNLEPGVYSLEARFLGMKDKVISNVIVTEQNLVLNFELKNSSYLSREFSCGIPPMRLFNLHDTSSGQTFTPSNGFLQPNILRW